MSEFHVAGVYPVSFLTAVSTAMAAAFAAQIVATPRCSGL